MTDQTPGSARSTYQTADGEIANYTPGASGFLDLLTKDDRARLLERCARRLLTRRQMLFSAGDPRTQVYVLSTGRVKLLRRTAQGNEVIITLCGPGELVGYSGLSGAPARLASAQEIEAGEAFTLDETEFRALLASRPTMALAVIESMRQRMEAVADSLTDVVSEDVPNRILRLLRRLARKQAGPRGGESVLDLRLTHQEVANMIGARRQTVTTAINDLHRAGTLRREQHRIVIAPEARPARPRSPVAGALRAAVAASIMVGAVLFGLDPATLA